MKVKAEMVIDVRSIDDDDYIWKEEYETALVDIEKCVISKEEIKYQYFPQGNYWKYTIVKEFEYNSLRDFIFDFEKDVEEFGSSLCYDRIRLSTVKVKEIEYDWLNYNK